MHDNLEDNFFQCVESVNGFCPFFEECNTDCPVPESENWGVVRGEVISGKMEDGWICVNTQCHLTSTDQFNDDQINSQSDLWVPLHDVNGKPCFEKMTRDAAINCDPIHGFRIKSFDGYYLTLHSAGHLVAQKEKSKFNIFRIIKKPQLSLPVARCIRTLCCGPCALKTRIKRKDIYAQESYEPKPGDTFALQSITTNVVWAEPSTPCVIATGGCVEGGAAKQIFQFEESSTAGKMRIKCSDGSYLKFSGKCKPNWNTKNDGLHENLINLKNEDAGKEELSFSLEKVTQPCIQYRPAARQILGYDDQFFPAHFRKLAFFLYFINLAALVSFMGLRYFQRFHLHCPSDDIGFHSNTSAPCFADWYIKTWGTSNNLIHAPQLCAINVFPIIDPLWCLGAYMMVLYAILSSDNDLHAERRIRFCCHECSSITELTKFTWYCFSILDICNQLLLAEGDMNLWNFSAVSRIVVGGFFYTMFAGWSAGFPVYIAQYTIGYGKTLNKFLLKYAIGHVVLCSILSSSFFIGWDAIVRTYHANLEIASEVLQMYPMNFSHPSINGSLSYLCKSDKFVATEQKMYSLRVLFDVFKIPMFWWTMINTLEAFRFTSKSVFTCNYRRRINDEGTGPGYTISVREPRDHFESLFGHH